MLKYTNIKQCRLIVKIFLEKIIMEVCASTDKQLASLVGRLCQNNLDKYQLLQERDELLYKARIKNRDVTAMENVIVSNIII